jgi:hypothetical protein
VKKNILTLRTVFLTALLLICAAGFAGRAAAERIQALDDDGTAIVPADETKKAPIFQESERDGIAIYIMTTSDDPALEAAIRVIAQDKLRVLEHVATVESIDEASVLLSFSAFRTRVEEREQIVYSFAYGAPDMEIVDGTPVSLPRYIYHEAVLTRPDELASSINGNIIAVDSNFIRHLR